LYSFVFEFDDVWMTVLFMKSKRLQKQDFERDFVTPCRVNY
jgi:hypothetical protein